MFGIWIAASLSLPVSMTHLDSDPVVGPGIDDVSDDPGNLWIRGRD